MTIPDSGPPRDLSYNPIEDADDVAAQMAEMDVSPALKALLERGLHASRLPKELRSAKAAEVFQQAFEVIGGMPRLALWADKNPDKFYTLYGRMIPQTIAPVLPDTQKTQIIDLPWVSARRLAYKDGLDVIQDIKDKGKKQA